ncbi:uncharacterized protein PHACADRAFT_106891, partial [Phanerochaete carnosa HHB-10118-sp]
QIDLHRIPNVCLGTAGHRQKTMIFFPHMYKPEGIPRVSKEEMALLYDSCIRPTVVAVEPKSIAHWPVNYEACLMSMRDMRKQFHFTTRDIPHRKLHDFATTLHTNLNNHPVFRDSFFVHELRGIKGRTMHSAANPQDCDDAFDDAFATFETGQMLQIPMSQWYIDVGVEIHAPGLALQWRTDSHQKVLEYALPTPSVEEISQTIEGRHFKKDVCSLLYDLSGFRVEVPTLGADDHVKYVNVYTTDKCATYQIHPGQFRRHRAQDLLPHRLKSFLSDVESLGVLYDTCAGHEAEVKQEGSARLELRAAVFPGSPTSHMLRDVTQELIESSIVGFDPIDWW